MPIYEYACGACGHQLDALQKLSDAPLVDCPACDAPQLKRQMSAPSFRLKGGGWYETDFKNDKRRNLAESDSKPAEAKSGEGKSGEGKSGEGKSGEGKSSDGRPADKADKADAKPAKTEAGKSDTGDKSAKPAAAEAKKADTTAVKKPDAGRVA
jgi:putative FmdB family regulatory protein